MYEHFEPDAEPQKFAAKEKFFGVDAQRVNREELNLAVNEIERKAGEFFGKISAVEQLDDKETFGDIDIIVAPQKESTGKPDLGMFEQIFGQNILGYHRNDEVYSVLVKLDDIGKKCQVDFVFSHDDSEFERKKMFYGKGHFSAMVGILAKKLNFKYGIQGFLKRYKDGKGNWHDIPVSDNLTDGLSIMGFDARAYGEVHTIDDIVGFVSSSPYFDSSFFNIDELNHGQRESIGAVASQQYIQSKLAAKKIPARLRDENGLFVQLFPEKYKEYLEEIERINKEINRRRTINGEIVMERFNLVPGQKVGRVLKYIAQNYSDAEEITLEMENKIREEVLK